MIIPFNALLQDLISEATRLQIKVATWPDKTYRLDLKRFVDYIPVDVNVHRLVLVSAHEAGDPIFLTWMRNLVSVHLLKRVVIDEAHEPLGSADYRHCMKDLKVIAELGVQLVFLTATLSPRSEENLLQFFNIPPNLSITIRAPTSCPEISYRFRRMPDLTAMVRRIQEVVVTTPLAKHERGLIFANSYHDCDMLSDLLKVPKYYGQMSATVKSSAFRQWTMGKYQWIIATSALGHGINNKFVRYILHFRAAGDIFRYAQETGRGGQDGQTAIAETIYVNIPWIKEVGSADDRGEIAMN